MNRLLPAIICLLLSLSACTENDPGSASEAPVLDYAFLNLDEDADAFSNLWSLITDSTDVYCAVSEWASPHLNQQMVEAFERVPGARLNLITDPNSWDKDTGDSITEVRHLLREESWIKGQIVLVNDRNPRAGRLGEYIHDPGVSLMENTLIFTSLQRPEYGDSAPALLILSSGISASGFPPHSYGLLIRGDIGLVDSYNDYWTQLHESRIDFEHRKVRTYSDRHDHRAWFFPDQSGVDSSHKLLGSLMEVVSNTGKPAKLRIYMPSWNESHLELAQVLKELAVEYEADVRILVQDSPATAGVIRDRLDEFPKGMVRWVPGLGQNPLIILDGPVKISEDALPERKQVVWVGAHAWDTAGLQKNSNSTLAIFSKSLADSLEEVWWTIWKNYPPPPAIDSLEID